MIRNADMGKVINMLASDFNTMEIKMTFVFMAMTLPFVALGAAIILVFRLGWIGLLCIAIPFVLLPLIGLIGKNSGTIQR
jgi:ATP-binding cassette subfamily C (CFTR/MRP) protein 4